MKKIGVLVALMSLLAIGVAYGASTFNTPTDGGVIDGNYFFNVSCGLQNSTNASITATSALTGSALTTTWLFNQFGAGAGDNASVANSSSTLGLVDAADWVFDGTCYNASGATEAITQITGVIVDNTKPICSFSNPVKSSTTYAATQTYTIVCTNATSATIAFGNNQAKAMTETSDVCTYTGTRTAVPEAAYARILVTTSDGTNTTTCQLNSITIDPGAPLQEAAALLASQGQKQSGGATGGTNPIIYVVIAGGLGYWYINRKGK